MSRPSWGPLRPSWANMGSFSAVSGPPLGHLGSWAGPWEGGKHVAEPNGQIGRMDPKGRVGKAGPGGQ
eukprot:9057347-Pyramimonas_sp.AAC.1